MPKRTGAQQLFGKSRVARQILRERAEEILTEYMDVIQKAKDNRDFATAAKALQWLIDHMPADEDGIRVVDQSVDKKQEIVDKGPKGPGIQIGIVVGGIGQKQIAIKKPEAITGEVIEDE